MALSPQYASTPIVGSGVLSATSASVNGGSGPYISPAASVTTQILTAAAVTVASASVTANSEIVTVVSGGFPSVYAGNYVAQSGVAAALSTIAAGTTVTSIVGNTLYLSTPAAASGVVTLTFQSNGYKVDEIDFVGTGTTVAGVCQLYLYDGTTYHAYYSQLVTVVTPSTTVAPFFQAQPFTNLEIPPGWSLVATSFVASQLLNVVAFGGSL